MGRKIRAAQASLVATFLAASGAATAKAFHAKSTGKAVTISGASINWGDELIRYLKLDGFPAYLKVEGFAQLAQYYKAQLLSDAQALYLKYADDVSNALALYHKADGGPLAGILIALEQYNKDNPQPLADYLKIKGNLDNYIKFQKVYNDLVQVARADGEKGSALDFYIKLTGISSVPSPDSFGDQGGSAF